MATFVGLFVIVWFSVSGAMGAETQSLKELAVPGESFLLEGHVAFMIPTRGLFQLMAMSIR